MFDLVYGEETQPNEWQATAERIVALETKIAAAHWDVVKRRDADLTYNLRAFTDIPTEAPGFDWATWLSNLGISDEQAAEVVVRQPDYLTAFAALWASEDLDDWKLWARWELINAAVRCPHRRAHRAELRVLRPPVVGHRADPRPLEARRVTGRGSDG